MQHYSIAKVAKILDVSRELVYKLTYSHQLPYLKVNSKKVISAKALEDFIRENTVK